MTVELLFLGSGQRMPLASDYDRLIGVAPPCDVALHWLDLPDLTGPQANAAARMQLADVALGEVHVVAGMADVSGKRPVAIVSHAHMAEWLAENDFDAIIPAPLLIAPREGFVRAVLDSEPVIRGAEAGFSDDPALTAALLSGAPVKDLDEAAILADIEAAASHPSLDLRQGAYARKASWLPDRNRIRRLGILATALFLMTLAIPLIQLIRLNLSAAGLENETTTIARKALGEAVSENDAAETLRARLAGLRGGGGGFAGTAGAVNAALAIVPNTELSAMAFDPDGTMRVSVRAASQRELDALVARLKASGLLASASTPGLDQGRPTIDLRVIGQ